MGQVIRKDAAADLIFADVGKTLANAKARGGTWQALAEQKLGAVMALVGSVESDLAAARATAVPVVAAEHAASAEADHVVGKVADDVWNAIGRPGYDPVYAVIFPGGIAHYADGASEEHPDRLDLLATLLRAGLHKRIDAALGASLAAEVDAASATLRKAVDAARAPKARVSLLEHMRTAAARSAAHELAALKRLYKSEGFSEAEIHAVIPDRPVHTAAPAAATAAAAKP